MDPSQETSPIERLAPSMKKELTTQVDRDEDQDAAALPHFFSQIVSSIFDGGVNPSLIIGMHASFLGLELVLLALWVITNFNGHVLALIGISACLWGSTGWFVQELLSFQRQQKLAEAGKGESDERQEVVISDSTEETDRIAIGGDDKKDR